MNPSSRSPSSSRTINTNADTKTNGAASSHSDISIDMSLHHNEQDHPSSPSSSPASASAPPRHLDSYSLHWNDLNQPKFLGLLTLASLGIRCALYPAALIKTRLQVHTSAPSPSPSPPIPSFSPSAPAPSPASPSPVVYRNSFHALSSISRSEGFPALYRGFRFNVFGVLMDPIGVAALETSRTKLTKWAEREAGKGKWWVPDSKGSSISLVAGGLNAMVAQTVLVPIDIVTQKIMLQTESLKKGKNTAVGTGESGGGGGPTAATTANRRPPPSGSRAFATISVPISSSSSPLPRSSSSSSSSSSSPSPSSIIRQIYHTRGLRGFYSGYFLTLCATVPYSSLVWTLYWRVQEIAKTLLGKKPLQHPPHSIHVHHHPKPGTAAVAGGVGGAAVMDEEWQSDWRELVTAPCSAAVSATVASLATQPFDVLKVRIQVAEPAPSSSSSSSISAASTRSSGLSLKEAFSKLTKEKGIKGLWSGSGARVAAVMPGSVIMMTAYEGIKRKCVKDEEDEEGEQKRGKAKQKSL